MSSTVDDTRDRPADLEIQACVNLAEPRSFFLYAGAGSGKTQSLSDAVTDLLRRQGRLLTLRGQKLGVITYTNAAAAEIAKRVKYDPRVHVSTIHSFAWSLLQGFDKDIRAWVEQKLRADILDLEQKQSRGRAASKAAADRARSIESKRRRLAKLDEVRRFVYSPTGDNRGRDALNHAEVIGMTAEFLNTKPAFALLLVGKFPVLLIDESQDTTRRLMEAFLRIQQLYTSRFCLGLFGDTMQRIYLDGKPDLEAAIPPDWARPAKSMNHRCPKRVIRLINAIRAEVDSHTQEPRSDKSEGFARLFLLPATTVDKLAAEAMVRAKMAKITGDDAWNQEKDSVKTLTVEHHMAATRFGFSDFFDPLYAADRLQSGVLEGTLGGVRFFTELILPLVAALKADNKYRVATILRDGDSPLLREEKLQSGGIALVRSANDACASLLALFKGDAQPSLLSVLRVVAASGLFELPESLQPYVAESDSDVADTEEDEDASNELVAWRRALDAPFDQLVKYYEYVSHSSPFDTHHGVKGLEFARVLVIVSDEEARGFTYKYAKLFETKGKGDGEESTLDRIRRLLYVTCSRAEESLALVWYAEDTAFVRDRILERGWFDDQEIEVV